MHSEDDEFDAINGETALENQVEHQDADNDGNVQMDIEQADGEEGDEAVEHQEINNESVNGSPKGTNQGKSLFIYYMKGI